MALLEVTPSGLPKILKRNALAKVFTMIKGSPSTAKSAIAAEFAREFNLFMIDIRLGQSDPTDLNGFPKIFANSMTGQESAGYVPFETFPTQDTPVPDGFSGWFLFFDELNSGDRGVAKAAYKIILDRMVGRYKLHDKVIMAGAGNLDTDDAIVEDHGSALQSRMCTVRMGIDREGFRNYTEANQYDRRISAFLHFKPGMAYAFDPATHGNEDNYPCYRTWDFTNRLLKTIPEDEFGDHETLCALAGNLGEGCAREFLAFCKLEDKLPSIEQILKSPESITVPKETGQLYALSGALGSNLVPERPEQHEALMAFTRRIPIEFQIITLRQAIRANPKLIDMPAIQSWVSDNNTEIF